MSIRSALTVPLAQLLNVCRSRPQQSFVDFGTDKKFLSFSVDYGYLVKSRRQQGLRSPMVVVFWLASSINFKTEMVRSTSTQTAGAFLADNLCNGV